MVYVVDNCYNMIVVDVFNEIDIRALEGETVSRCYRLNKEVQQEFSKFCKRNSSYKVQDILGTALVEFMEKYK